MIYHIYYILYIYLYICITVNLFFDINRKKYISKTSRRKRKTIKRNKKTTFNLTCQ